MPHYSIRWGKPLLLCEDPGVIGTPFYLMQHVKVRGLYLFVGLVKCQIYTLGLQVLTGTKILAGYFRLSTMHFALLAKIFVSFQYCQHLLPTITVVLENFA